MKIDTRSRPLTIKFLLLACVLVLALAACERPLQSGPDVPAAPATDAPAPQDEATTAPTPTVEPAAPSDEETPVEETPTEETPAEETPTEAATPEDEDQSPRDEGEGEEEPGSSDEPATTPEPTAEPTEEPTAEATAEPTEEPAGSTEEQIHVVQAGENLYRIGLQYGISWTVLAEYNNIANPNSLIVGQEIRIPPTAEGDQEGAATPAPQITHVVQPGETLFIISQQYGVVWTDIAAANNLVAPYTIHAGDTLVIPGG